MPRQVISKNNLSPLIEIIIWFALTVSILTVIVRVVIKLRVLKRVDYDDYFIAASLVISSWITEPTGTRADDSRYLLLPNPYHSQSRLPMALDSPSQPPAIPTSLHNSR